MGFGMLVINEYLQLIAVFGRTFDYFDIFFSFAGLSLSYFVYGRLMRKMQLI
jgi:glycopeptide antibiotics resistance protein